MDDKPWIKSYPAGMRWDIEIEAAPLQKILDDAEGRKALWERLQFALDGEPDPWFEFDKAQVDLRQFQPLRPVIQIEETA